MPFGPTEAADTQQPETSTKMKQYLLFFTLFLLMTFTKSTPQQELQARQPEHQRLKAQLPLCVCLLHPATCLCCLGCTTSVVAPCAPSVAPYSAAAVSECLRATGLFTLILGIVALYDPTTNAHFEKETAKYTHRI